MIKLNQKAIDDIQLYIDCNQRRDIDGFDAAVEMLFAAYNEFQSKIMPQKCNCIGGYVYKKDHPVQVNRPQVMCPECKGVGTLPPTHMLIPSVNEREDNGR